MDNQAKALIMVLVLSLIMGVIVISFNQDFRIDKILKSNRTYFPLAKVEGRE
ncbi:MAG TPA: hypothetical protein PLD27_07760 [bacterium]|nr:hypothetical protein [bacterium]HOL47523.1 hypothetical protein [bacterium]HPQ19125.1 hypothetical protein [bacterium]